MIVTLTLSPGSLRGLVAALGHSGFTVRERPLVRFVPPADPAPLEAAFAAIKRYRAIAVSSPRAAAALRERCIHASAGVLPQIWAAGPGTAGCLRGFAAARTPAGSGAAALADLMLAEAGEGPVLYLCGAERRDELPERLRAAGRTVHEVVCYRAKLARQKEIAAALEHTDLILIGSHRLIVLAAPLARTGGRPGLVCLGEATARTARALGWEPAAVADRPTAEGVVIAIKHATQAPPPLAARAASAPS